MSTMFDSALLGRLGFRLEAHQPPTLPPLPPGEHLLGLSEERDALLVVPEGLDTTQPLPLLVMFHGAGGFPRKVLPFLQPHVDARKFLLLLPHSQLVTWDIVIGGNGPDLERLDQALAIVASHFTIDPTHLGFMGHSDGASYTLSTGITNGDVASHVIAMSGGFMTVFHQNGAPKVFIAHGVNDEQLPIDSSARRHVEKLKAAAYDVTAIEFNGPHRIQPPIVAIAIAFFLGPPKPAVPPASDAVPPAVGT